MLLYGRTVCGVQCAYSGFNPANIYIYIYIYTTFTLTLTLERNY